MLNLLRKIENYLVEIFLGGIDLKVIFVGRVREGRSFFFREWGLGDNESDFLGDVEWSRVIELEGGFGG